MDATTLPTFDGGRPICTSDVLDEFIATVQSRAMLYRCNAHEAAIYMIDNVMVDPQLVSRDEKRTAYQSYVAQHKITDPISFEYLFKDQKDRGPKRFMVRNGLLFYDGKEFPPIENIHFKVVSAVRRMHPDPTRGRGQVIAAVKRSLVIRDDVLNTIFPRRRNRQQSDNQQAVVPYAASPSMAPHGRGGNPPVYTDILPRPAVMMMAAAMQQQQQQQQQLQQLQQLQQQQQMHAAAAAAWVAWADDLQQR